jgi:hypothetical protein
MQLSHGPHRERLFPVIPLVYVRNLLPSSGCCLQGCYLATGLHTTIQIILERQLLAFADDLNPLVDNTDIIKKNTESLLCTTKETGLEVNAEKSKDMLLSHYQNGRQNHSINITNRPFENVSQFRYSGRQ